LYAEKSTRILNYIRWSSVVRGAVCRGLEGPQAGLVEVRLARKYYGTPASEPFNARIHDQSDRYIDEYDGRAYARGQMTWLVDKGERLPEKTPKVVSIECSASFRLDEERQFGAVLVGCDEDEAPRRYAHNSMPQAATSCMETWLIISQVLTIFAELKQTFRMYLLTNFRRTGRDCKGNGIILRNSNCRLHLQAAILSGASFLMVDPMLQST
jgi:hypothetical protein